MRSLLVFILIFFLLPSVLAAGEYKPYLHKPVVPEHPQVRLFGQYNTLLFPGAATYTYAIDVPAGTHGLAPSLSLMYNSQSMQQRPGVLGAGWAYNSNSIYREVNGTPASTADDRLLLSFENSLYELIYNPDDGLWHTEVDYHFKIRNVSGGTNTYGSYWLLTTKDGVTHRFGYTSESELASNTGNAYAVRWSQDLVTDAFGNTITYAYAENPFAEDSGAVYLTSIRYNTDERRVIDFTYESTPRPDRRLVFENANRLDESRRLVSIGVYADDTLIRRYQYNYTLLGPALSSLSSITRYGADNRSVLHTVSFGYYAPDAGFTKNSTWAPPVLFTNDTGTDFGIRVMDADNDGYADLLEGRESTAAKRAWMNTRAGWALVASWVLPVYFVDNSSADYGVRSADIDNNGFIDLLQARAGTRSVYTNNGTGWASNGSWSIPLDFADGSGVDQGVQLADLNGDGRVDLLKAKGGNRTVYLQSGTTWVSAGWSVPVDLDDASAARLVDVNGDGLPDILQGLNTSSVALNAWLNNGSGWTNYTVLWTPPVGFTTTAFPDNGVRFLDVNGDGLSDIVQNLQNGSTSLNNTWLNNGSGWVLNNTWLTPEPMVKGTVNSGRRLADVDGDGFADIVVAQQNGSTNYTWTKTNGYSFLLKNITNEYGGVTTINYTTSTQYNNTDDDGVSDIGFALFVVRAITARNGLDGAFGVTGVTNYSYRAGKYDYARREFRGFGMTTEQKSSGVTVHRFFQDHPRRSKEYRTEVYALDGSLLLASATEFNYTYKYGVYNITLLSSTQYQYDGLSVPSIVNTSYDYDWFGNPRTVVELGDIAVSGDERTTRYTYAYNTDAWLMDKPARVTVYDADGEKVKESTLYYDSLGFTGMGSTGRLTRREEWNNQGENPFMVYAYDAYGNVVSSVDSAGNTAYQNYDASHTYLASSINALGHITRYAYDLGTGNLQSVEKNGITTSYEYDTHGRIEKEVRPGDSSQLPTKQYAYGLDGMAPEQINISLRTTADNSMDASYYYDGFGQLVQSVLSRENDQIIKNLYYDGLGRAVAEDNPYLAALNGSISAPMSGTPQTNYTYDALDRVVFVRNPDGTNKTTAFTKENISDYDENGHRHKYVVDALGRIVAVHEFNNDPHTGASEEEYITTYEYDGNDNLIQITDHLGNTFNFTYDSLSRKVRMEDPDMGLWAYDYDARGNLISQNDSRGAVIALHYDALNRILAKNSSDVNMTFSYDAQYQGTLTNVTSLNQTRRFVYDERMRPIGVMKDLLGTPFPVSLLYDSQDRLVSQEGLGSELDYLYDRQGKVRTIPDFVNASSYDAFGSLLNRTYANGLIAKYEYHSQNHRLLNITIPNVQRLNYTYDNVGNILRINDVVAGKVSTMTYDDLDRLVTATIGDDRYVYRYNPTGNMMAIVKNNESKKFVYAGRAHAPSSIIESAAGVDVYHIGELTGSKNRTFEFFLLNDKLSNTSANVSVAFGDGKSLTKNNVTIGTSVLFLVQNNYSHGGDYAVAIVANSSNSSDRETQDTKFGIRAESLGIIDRNVSKRTFEWVVDSDVVDTLSNVSWSCNENLSYSGVTLSNAASLYDYLQYNYSSPGSKTFACTAFGDDGNESKSISFSVDGLSVRSYDVLLTNVSRRIVGFDAHNEYYALETNVSVQSEFANFSRLANISSDESVLVFAELNNTQGAEKEVVVRLSSGNESSNYSAVYALDTVRIEDFNRVDQSNITKVFFYTVRNTWHDGLVSWNLSEPNIVNSTTLANNASVLVMVQHNYSQGEKQPTFIATSAGLSSSLRDAFSVRGIALTDLQVLTGGNTSTTELTIWNYLPNSTTLTWNYDSGVQNITNATSVNHSMLIYVQTNYSMSAVYRTQGLINGSGYTDNRSGVVVS